MDSVESRENGTIGGFCLATVVAEEQCLVPNSYCSEKSLTCQCRPGYELRIEDIEDRNEKVRRHFWGSEWEMRIFWKFKGVCMKVEGSRFQGTASERKLRDEAGDGDEDGSMDFDDGPSANAFYAVEFSTDEGTNSTLKIDEKGATNETIKIENGSEESKLGELENQEREGAERNKNEIALGNEGEEPKKLLERVLFQS